MAKVNTNRKETEKATTYIKKRGGTKEQRKKTTNKFKKRLLCSKCGQKGNWYTDAKCFQFKGPFPKDAPSPTKKKTGGGGGSGRTICVDPDLYRGP